ncbi:type II toxin-antitoxin system VapC family toxin [Candidatus Woesearchaeota archaeon]|nr:type II toxin-antitoxin system VapC family toxin [Candidatus Woesearchaeota archaeon]
MICLDSDFIVDFLRKKSSAVLKMESLKGQTVASTEVNYLEVIYGILIKKQVPQKEFALAQEFFDSVPSMPLDHISAYNTAKIAAFLKKSGQEIELSDTMIAGICLANNCPILTKNIKHFSRIKGLKVETY